MYIHMGINIYFNIPAFRAANNFHELPLSEYSLLGILYGGCHHRIPFWRSHVYIQLCCKDCLLRLLCIASQFRVMHEHSHIKKSPSRLPNKDFFLGLLSEGVFNQSHMQGILLGLPLRRNLFWDS